MPAYEATPEELAEYGNNLNIWEQIRLLSAWAPLLSFAQRFVIEPDPYRKSLIVGEAAEWVASRTDSTADDRLVKLAVDVLKTPQGEAMVRYFISLAQEAK
jgi:hypothetical protein